MAQRLTLDETWTLQMALSGWVAKQWKKGRQVFVPTLKKEWLKKHGYRDIRADCFFCDCVGGICPDCPARKVDSNFSCSDPCYHYLYHPIKFYAKLVDLNEMRKRK